MYNTPRERSIHSYLSPKTTVNMGKVQNRANGRLMHSPTRNMVTSISGAMPCKNSSGLTGGMVKKNGGLFSGGCVQKQTSGSYSRLNFGSSRHSVGQLSESKRSHPSQQSTLTHVRSSIESQIVILSQVGSCNTNSPKTVTQQIYGGKSTIRMCESLNLAANRQQIRGFETSIDYQQKMVPSQNQTRYKNHSPRGQSNRRIPAIATQECPISPTAPSTHPLPSNNLIVERKSNVVAKTQQPNVLKTCVPFILFPNIFLNHSTPKSVISNKKIPVLGSYYSKDKSKKFTLREFSNSKSKPISVKIVNISPYQAIPTEVFKIKIRNSGRMEQSIDSGEGSRLEDSRRSYSSDMSSSRLSNFTKISVYSSPDVVIFSPVFFLGPKLKKNHVKRIAVQGKDITNPISEGSAVIAIPEVSEVEDLTPLEKYLNLKKTFNLDLSLRKTFTVQIINPQECAALIPVQECQIVVPNSQFQHLIELENIEKAVSESVPFQDQANNINSHSIWESQPFQSHIGDSSTILQRYSITDMLQDMNRADHDQRDYTRMTISTEILLDLKKLKHKNGQTLVSEYWYKSNRTCQPSFFQNL